MKNFTTNLSTFLFRRSWGDVFADLTDEDAGKLIKAVYTYTNGIDAPPESFLLKTLYKMMTNQINYSARKYVSKWEKPYSDEES